MGHPDHGNAGSLVLKAAMLAGEQGFEPQEDPHWIRSILYYASPVTIVVKNLGYENYPNLYVSIDEASAEKKKQALLVMKEVMGFTNESIEASWKSTAQPDHPKVEAFTQVRPPVVEYLESYDSEQSTVTFRQSLNVTKHDIYKKISKCWTEDILKAQRWSVVTTTDIGNQVNQVRRKIIDKYIIS